MDECKALFAGAAAVGSKVVFAPYNNDVVLVLDTTGNTFSTVASGGSGTTPQLYMGATALGTKAEWQDIPYRHGR